MAATTKPITTTFFRPNLEKKKRIRGQQDTTKSLFKKDERECLMKTNLCCSEKSKKITNETKNG